MPNRIICFVLAAGFIQTVLNYAAQINISSATTATVSNFYQDFSYCSCDRTPSLCDNYCCCDSLCSSVPESKSRPQSPHGPTPTVASLPHPRLSTSATNPRNLATAHSMTSRACTTLIAARLDTSIRICRPPPSTTPPSINCT